MSNGDAGVPIEQFIQALQTQLDRAQTAMALKAENLDLPLTFAVKDLSLDLRTHVEVVRSEIRIRPAGSGDRDASTLHLALTTITRPMIKENAKSLSMDPDEQSLKDAVGDQLTDEEQKRLEWAGVHTVSQLRKLTDSGARQEVGRVADLPVERLKKALLRASRPLVDNIEPQFHPPGDEADPSSTLLRIRGRNLMGAGLPHVSIGGHSVKVLSATDRELLIAPESHHELSGMLSIETAPGSVAEMAVDLAASIPDAKSANRDETKPAADDGGQA